jgi:hypothetical protein
VGNHIFFRVLFFLACAIRAYFLSFSQFLGFLAFMVSIRLLLCKDKALGRMSDHHKKTFLEKKGAQESQWFGPLASAEVTMIQRFDAISTHLWKEQSLPCSSFTLSFSLRSCSWLTNTCSSSMAIYPAQKPKTREGQQTAGILKLATKIANMNFQDLGFLVVDHVVIFPSSSCSPMR